MVRICLQAVAWASSRIQSSGIPLFCLGLAAMVGVLLAEWNSGVSLGWWFGIACMLFIFACWRMRTWAVLVATASIFGFHYKAIDTDRLRNLVESSPNGGYAVQMKGLITTHVDADVGAAFSWKCGVKLESVNGVPWEGSRVFIKFRSLTPPKYGDSIFFEGSMKPVPAVRNPGEFDYANYLRHEGYSGEVYIGKSCTITVLKSGEGSSIYAAALASRDWLAETVTRGLEGDPTMAATIRAMVLGTQESTPQDVEEAFVNSGTMHVFAVSGLHVVLFAWVLMQFLKPFRLGRGWLLLIVIPVMFFFVFITGMRASAWRAAIMASLMLSACLLNRRSEVFNSLGAAGLLLLVWDPHQAFSAGFQLSFGVLIALAILTRFFMMPLRQFYTLDPFIPRQLITDGQRTSLYIRKKMLECLAVSTASTIGSAPLMISHFGLLTPIGIVANLFLVFISTAILFTACVSILFAGVKLTFLSEVINNANYAFAISSVNFATFFSQIPGGHFYINSRPWRSGETAVLTVLDIPRGGAASSWIEPETSWLLDCGGKRHWQRTVRPHLIQRQVVQLDALFLTHRDTDHTGAAGDVRLELKPKRVFLGPRTNPQTRSIATDATVYAGDHLTPSPATQLDVIYPQTARGTGVADDRCSVFLIRHGPWKILFLGDGGFMAEKWIIEKMPSLRADIIVKGRSAYDISGLPELLNQLQPKAVILSNSRFPKEQRVPENWLDMARGKGISVFNQQETGAVEVSIRGPLLEISGFMNGQPVTFQK